MAQRAARTGEVTIWISRPLIIAIHDEQLSEHGGGSGIRDEGLLESALARPLNRAGYGEPDIAELAAVYALGIARNHPFVDGNKRTAFGAMVTFLSLNGMELEALESEAYMAALAMASGEMPEDDFITWVRAHAVPA
jgi:death on curing protein